MATDDLGPKTNSTPHAEPPADAASRAAGEPVSDGGSSGAPRRALAPGEHTRGGGRLARAFWRRVDPLPDAALVLLVIGLPLALGGALPPTSPVAAGLLAVAFAAHAMTARRRGARMASHGFGLVLLALAAIAALQAVPLPLGLVELLSPQTAAAHAEVARLLGAPAAFGTLSLDPAASAVEAARWMAAALAFLLAHHAAASAEDRATKLLSLVALSGAVVLGVTALNSVAGGGVWFGLYTPRDTLEPSLLTSPILNPNHLAGFLNLTGFVALGRAQQAESGRERALFGAIFFAALSGSALTLSRGGVAAAVAGAALFAWLSYSHRRSLVGRRRGGPRPMVVAGAVVLLTVCGVAVHEGLEYGFSHLGSADEILADPKLAIQMKMPELLRTYPFVGVGAGAVAAGFAAFNDVVPGAQVTHAENLVLDLLVQYGLPIGVFVMGWALFLLAGPFWRATRTADSLGAVIGLYALALQNLFDFSLFMAGVAVPAVVVIGAVLGLDAGERRELSPRTAPRQRLRPGLGMALAALGLALAVWAGHHGWRHSDARVDEFMRARAAGPVDFESEAAEDAAGPPALDFAAVARLRPADPHFALLEAISRLREGDEPGAEAWMEAAHRRAPHAFGPLLLRARLAAERGDFDEAISHFAECFARHPGRRALIADEVVQRLRRPELVERALPPDEEDLHWVVLRMRKRDQRAIAEGVLRARLARTPDAAALRWELALLLLERGAPATEIDRQATQLMARDPARAAGFIIQGMLFERTGRDDESLVMFEEAHALEPDDPHALLGQARVLARQGRFDEFAAIAGQVRPLVADRPGLRAELLLTRSQVARKTGRLQDATLDLETAVSVQPRSPRLLAELGTLKAQLHDEHGARSAFERALYISPGFPPALDGLARLDLRRGGRGE